jgi:hypothetical protein
MNVIVLINIEGLAQNFLKAPRVSRNSTSLSIVYDYEMDSGAYGEKNISFEDVKDYRQVVESSVTPDMMKAYNSIGEVADSSWLDHEMKSQGYKHYIIYFDEYGAYEILAKKFQL